MQEHLSLRQKIGQMMMVGLPGKEIDPEFQRLIDEYKIGNVILFTRNMQSARQVRDLCAEMQKRIRQSTGIPAFISVDQEGGMVSRMPEDATNFPGAMAVAATGNPHNAFIAGSCTAQELCAMGINVDIAPVLDINSNPDNPVIGVRSYGDQPEVVSRFGIEMMRGLKSGGVMPVIKHFPGHGDTLVDSHLGLPEVKKTLEELAHNELIPFQNAINNDAECVMTSHILFPAIEKEKVPGTMSSAIITELLKQKLKFGGLVMTDCLEMNAIQSYYGTANGALAAVRAGAHIVCISHTAKLAQDAVNLLENAVRSGELPEVLIDEAVKKIMYTKQKYANDLPPEDQLFRVGCAAHRKEAARISSESISLVRGTIPLSMGKTLFIGSYASRSTLASSAIDRTFSFPNYMKQKFGGKSVIINLDTTADEITAIGENAKRFNTVVIGTYNGHLHRGQISLVNRLCGDNVAVVAVALRNPYDLKMIDSRATAIAAYEYTKSAFDSLVNLFKCGVKPTGQLTVSL